MSSVVHFEIPADDMERVQKFYNRLLGWKFEKMPGDIEYFGIKTRQSDDQPGIDGGLMKRQMPGHNITNYIEVENIDIFTKRVEELGGKVILPKTPVKAFGYFAVCMDTENNHFGFWMNDATAK